MSVRITGRSHSEEEGGAAMSVPLRLTLLVNGIGEPCLDAHPHPSSDQTCNAVSVYGHRCGLGIGHEVEHQCCLQAQTVDLFGERQQQDCDYKWWREVVDVDVQL
jgi:hypothetical protein